MVLLKDTEKLSTPCALRSDNISKLIVYTFDNLHGANNFDLVYDDFNKTDDYNIFFQHCYNQDVVAISFNLHSAMYNLDSGAPIAKACSLLLRVLYDFYISYTDCAQCWPSIILPFTSEVLNGLTPVTLIVLICCGWPLLVKPYSANTDLCPMYYLVYANLGLNAIKLVYDQIFRCHHEIVCFVTYV
ncbi:hypothetical protein IFM89_016899 [Coptis chinensis]|uniref:Uncharacterized protein n=1 Tax=Coptis chinensis TaxID=261450 RepID=A0A835I5H0_9MAGN|nr:hypothetical protein IFM89_016899 [Coptis chinensis]